jgi:hypothetical protein
VKKISIIIVSWNCKDYIDECLYSLKINNNNKENSEIIVIDNNSSDDSINLIQNKYPEVKLIKNTRNLGFSKANNQGIKQASGEYILLLNPDTKIFSNTIDELAQELMNNKKYGAVGPMIKGQDGKIQLTCARNYPSLLTELFWLSTLSRRFPKNKIIGNYLMSYWDHESSREVACLSGACILVKAEILKNLKGFDEDYYMYGEDVDLCYRIKQQGSLIFYNARSKIYHYGGASSEAIANKAVIYDRSSIQLFFRKHFGLVYALLYRFECILLSTILSGILSIILCFFWGQDRWKFKKLFIESIMVVFWGFKLESLIVK